MAQTEKPDLRNFEFVLPDPVTGATFRVHMYEGLLTIDGLTYEDDGSDPTYAFARVLAALRGVTLERLMRVMIERQGL